MLADLLLGVSSSPLLLPALVLGGSVAAFLGGWWVARSSWSAKRAELVTTSQTAIQLLADVSQRTDSISRELAEYRQLLALLAARADATGESGSATDVVEQFVELNHLLQERLEESQRALQNQSRQLAMYISEARVDALSGLPNRRALNEELERQHSFWCRHGHVYSALMIDVDHFKQLNDLYGHQAGDSVLQALASTLRETLRTSDFTARFGGEEFVAVLRGSDLPMAIRAAQRCCDAVRRLQTRYHDRDLQVTISCGVATIQTNEDAMALVERADQALYHAKRNGRDVVSVHDGNGIRPGFSVLNDYAGQEEKDTLELSCSGGAA